MASREVENGVDLAQHGTKWALQEWENHRLNITNAQFECRAAESRMLDVARAKSGLAWPVSFQSQNHGSHESLRSFRRHELIAPEWLAGLARARRDKGVRTHNLAWMETVGIRQPVPVAVPVDTPQPCGFFLCILAKLRCPTAG